MTHEEHYRNVCEPMFRRVFAQGDNTATVIAEWTSTMRKLNKLLEGNGRPPLDVVLDRFSEHVESERHAKNQRGESVRRLAVSIAAALLIAVIGAAYSGYKAAQASEIASKVANELKQQNAKVAP